MSTTNGKKRGIITGAAGFAGYSLTSHLLLRGYELYTICRPGSPHNLRLTPNNILSTLKSDNIKGSINSDISVLNMQDVSCRLHMIEIDSSEYSKLPELIDDECDLLFHLTWVGERDDFATQFSNIEQAIDVVEGAYKLGCKRVIFTGSQAEYGVKNCLISEDLITEPLYAYGAAKVAAQNLTKIRCEQLGIEWIWGRIFSLYGLYEPKGRMLPDLVARLKRGETMSLSSCRQNWDYLDAGDAAEAIISLAERGHSGEIYNLANGDSRPLKEFVEEIRSIVNPAVQIEYGDDSDPFISLRPDVSKILSHTGWRPKVKFMQGYFE